MSQNPSNMMARYYSFPTLEQMLQAETKIGESEIALELMGFNVSMLVANVTTCNEDEMALFERASKDALGPGFFVIIAGDSPGDFAYKKKVLETVIAQAKGESLKCVEDPETEGILHGPMHQDQRLDQGDVPTGRVLQGNPHHGSAGPDRSLGGRSRQGQAAADREGPHSG